MMSLSVLWLLSPLAVVLQAAPAAPTQSNEAFTHAEKVRLDSDGDIEDRVKIYESVSTRHLRSMQALVKEESDKIPAGLEAWAAAIETSREDIEKHISRNKKSRALIRYEIHLRKAITELNEIKFKRPAEASEAFEKWNVKAEEVRRRFVSILFPS